MIHICHWCYFLVSKTSLAIICYTSKREKHNESHIYFVQNTTIGIYPVFYLTCPAFKIGNKLSYLLPWFSINPIKVKQSSLISFLFEIIPYYYLHRYPQTLDHKYGIESRNSKHMWSLIPRNLYPEYCACHVLQNKCIQLQICGLGEMCSLQKPSVQMTISYTFHSNSGK